MPYAICTVPAAAVRKDPDHRIEMVNQLLFGEAMQVLEQRDEWFKIRSVYDDYEGWLTHHLITETNELLAKANANYFASDMVNEIIFCGESITIPFGSALTGFTAETKLLWNANYKYEGNYRNSSESFDTGSLLKTAGCWLNAPYLWGGKTLMGVDCSGFVQTVFKIYGVKLKRDAYQQAEQGIAVENLSNAKQGDLAFFHNENERIIHVGIILEANRIVHASGKVRIDTIDEKGILNRENGKRTHQLHSVRRFF